MATVGQCKACSQVVSDEAVTCPHCGQPRPCLLPPPIGSIHDGHIISTSYSDVGYYYGVTLSAGIQGVLFLSDSFTTLKVGDAVRVRISAIDTASHNSITFSLEK